MFAKQCGVPSGYDLQELFTATPLPTVLVDRECRIAAENEALRALGNWACAGPSGRDVADLSPAIARHLEDDFRRLDAGLPLPEHEAVIGERSYRVSVRALRQGGTQATGLVVSLVDITGARQIELRLAEAQNRLERYAHKDALTGLWNRRHFDEVLTRQISRCIRELTPLSLVLVDVDRLGGLNEEYGRGAGDKCLRSVAGAVRDRLRRPGDEACRYAGDEFAVLLPNTKAAGAAYMAEALRGAVDRLELANPRSEHGRVTISLGVANLDVVGLDVAVMRDELVQAADKALGSAKAAGCNAVRIWATSFGDVGWGGEPDQDYFLGTLLASHS